MIALLYIIISFFTIIIARSFPKEYIWIIFIISALLFSLIALFMTPNKGVYIDTIRFFDEMNQLRNIRYLSGINASWHYCLDQLGYNGAPIAGLYVLIISLFDSNGLLLMVTAFIQIYFAFIWIKKIADNSIEFNSAITWGLLFFLSSYNFMAAVSGVRNNLAFLIFGYLTYIYIYESKYKLLNFIISILLCFFHPSILIFLFIRLFNTVFLNKKILFIFNLLLLFNNFLQTIILTILSNFSSIPFVSQLLFKSTQYLGPTAYIQSNSDFSLIRNAIKLLIIILIITFYKLHSEYKLKPKYNAFFISVFCFAIGSFSDDILFGRTVLFLMYIIIPYFVTVFCQKKYIVKTRIENLLLMCMLLIILLITTFNLVDNARATIRFVHLALLNI